MNLALKGLSLLFLLSPLWGQAYQRNQARPVEQIVFGQIESLRGITEQQRIDMDPQGYDSLLGSIVGGVIGHQFGGGRGKVLATATGAVAGALIYQQPRKASIIEYQLVEMLIRTEDDGLIDVIQDYDPNMLFRIGSSVRILYFSDGVRVDLSY